MSDCQSIEPAAFGQYLATNGSKEADYVVLDTSGQVIAAKWHRPASRRAAQQTLAQHTLRYHVGGSTSVAKFVSGRCIGTHAPHGSITFSPRDERAEWVHGGACEVMHVYIAPSLLDRYADESSPSARAPEIDPVFAIQDPWLQGYFTMLQSEFETFGRGIKHPDGWLLTQSMALLIRHLICWHSNISRETKKRALQPAVLHPLAPRHLARVLDYIDANIARDLALADLAKLVGVSTYYLIRSFRAATGRTPYAYLVERRLTRAVEALRHSSMPVDQVAREAGFKSSPGFSNVFKKHYGMSPSKFRTRCR